MTKLFVEQPLAPPGSAKDCPHEFTMLRSWFHQISFKMVQLDEKYHIYLILAWRINLWYPTCLAFIFMHCFNGSAWAKAFQPFKIYGASVNEKLQLFVDISIIWSTKRVSYDTSTILFSLVKLRSEKYDVFPSFYMAYFTQTYIKKKKCLSIRFMRF